ncbi:MULTISPECIES: ParB/RepB/Spo0J family partition protein [unclassified Yoonia]|uniref:ParB/RepB/Spo0J family partition protein n=1 Tax=unclassified Yoonia TaxID=2629118 RepID=UPI002AFEF559|nr:MULTISPECIES: ParB/RepB/Spo0J family partition protein [unclassified Yoonia]
MSRAKLVPSITELALADIHITDDRLRPVDITSVEVIAHSIEEHGLLYPLTVRRMPKGRFELVDGGHRFAALLGLNHKMAPVRCYEGPAPSIRMIEIDANLARADLSDLDRAIHLASRRKEYLAEHPETAQGKAGAAARWNDPAELPLHSFAKMTAEQTGLNERKIRRYIEAGAELDKVLAEKLRSAPTRVTLNDLLAFAKAEPKLRAPAIARFASGDVKKIAHALKTVSSTAVKDPVERAFKRLKEAWDRAPKSARKRFMSHEASEIYEFLVAEGMLK